jgi:hypothetical protein
MNRTQFAATGGFAFRGSGLDARTIYRVARRIVVGRVREFQTRSYALACLSTSCKMEIESGIMDQLAY